MDMSSEKSGTPEVRARRLVELRWQREVIERWLRSPGNLAEGEAELKEMLAYVNRELQKLEAPSLSGKDGATPRKAG